MLAYKNSSQNLGKKFFKPYNKRFIKFKSKKQLTSNKISFASRHNSKRYYLCDFKGRMLYQVQRSCNGIIVCLIY